MIQLLLEPLITGVVYLLIIFIPVAITTLKGTHRDHHENL